MQGVFDVKWRGQALQGDAGAIGLFSAVLEPLFQFCLYRVGNNRHLCEEAVQETLVRAIRELERYQPQRCDGNILPWLTGLARNEIHRLLDRRHSESSLEALWARIDEDLRAAYAALESEPLAEDVLQREETRQMVNAAMAQLPLRYREALEAKYVEGHSVREMAAARSMTEKAAESQLGRARKAFRKTFLTLARNLSFDAP